METRNEARNWPGRLSGVGLTVARKLLPSQLADLVGVVHSFGDPLDPSKVFLTDDSDFGWKILKERGWAAMLFRFRGTEHRELDSWREHVDHFYGAGVSVIESVEDLLLDLNGAVAFAES